ncbi:MAG TPA: arginine deiminase-related protein [Terriglobales bacterium]|nr:arginine deiminase-related protein [Terriglobales bacterium]
MRPGDVSTANVPGGPMLHGPTFLMCPPTFYDVTYVINPWMDGNVNRSSRENAVRQWDGLYGALKDVARVELVEQQAGSPDMVFTANAGLVRKGVVALARFLHPERQGEEPHFRKWFDESGLAVLELPRDTPFEGEGDALFEADNSRLWAGHGMRSKESSHGYLRETWGVEVISLRLVDPRFYHLDTCFCPLFGGYVLYYPEAFDGASQAKIAARYPQEKRIPVEATDALRFACNAVNVGKTIVLNEVSDALVARLETHGFFVIQLPLTEFLKAGGAAKCLVLRLSDMEATHGFAGIGQTAAA